MHLLLALILLQDLDHDGLDDRLEQQLIERFVPSFLISAGECDTAPASFVAGSPVPTLAARDGTIHAQAFPVGVPDSPDVQVEIHYFHLWSRDCGRRGHPLDVEHVSALVHEERNEWVATLWYAAAHENTVCEKSSGAHAATLNAELSGPDVYVSEGKHASFFSQNQCRAGCGGDDCRADSRLAVRAVVNIGERGAPLNGALWTASSRWPLGQKLGSDFDPAVRARLDQPASTGKILTMTASPAGQAPVLAADAALDALKTTRQSTGSALRTAGRSVSRFLQRGQK
jgi:hypothetical protein